MRYDSALLMDPEGREVWSGPQADLPVAIRQHVPRNAPCLATLCNAAGTVVRPDGSVLPRESDVTAAAEAIGLIDRQGTPRGFYTLPPAGAFLERCVEAFNRRHFATVRAAEILLPGVYSASSSEIAELTAGYESAGRIFRLETSNNNLRLSYAADPALFSWLKGRRLRGAALPFTFVSPTQIFRKFQSGELGPLGRTCQYQLPDLHVLCRPDAAEQDCLDLVDANAAAARFWVGDSIAQFLDVTKAFLATRRSLVERMAGRARCYTIVNIFTEQPRYYRMRSGILVDAGSRHIMFYNIQWDEENGARFGMRLEGRQRAGHSAQQWLGGFGFNVRDRGESSGGARSTQHPAGTIQRLRSNLANRPADRARRGEPCAPPRRTGGQDAGPSTRGPQSGDQVQKI